MRHRQGDGALRPPCADDDRARARSRHGVDRAAELRGSGRDVEITSFEDWVAPPCAAFRLVMAAQSWHWVQPGVRLPKAHEVLVDDGALALFWNRPDWPETAAAARDRRRVRTGRAGARRADAGQVAPGRRSPRVRRGARGVRPVRRGHRDRARLGDRHTDATRTWSCSTRSPTIGSSIRRQRERLFAEVGRAIDDAGGDVPGLVRRRAVRRSSRRLMDEPELRRRVASSPVARLATVRADGTSARRAGVLRRRRRPDRLGGRPQAEGHHGAASARQRARASGRQPPRRPLRRRLDAALVGARRRHRVRCATPGPSTSPPSTCWRRNTRSTGTCARPARSWRSPPCGGVGWSAG